jgi:hypothetical protein
MPCRGIGAEAWLPPGSSRWVQEGSTLHNFASPAMSPRRGGMPKTVTKSKAGAGMESRPVTIRASSQHLPLYLSSWYDGLSDGAGGRVYKTMSKSTLASIMSRSGSGGGSGGGGSGGGGGGGSSSERVGRRRDGADGGSAGRTLSLGSIASTCKSTLSSSGGGGGGGQGHGGGGSVAGNDSTCGRPPAALPPQPASPPGRVGLYASATRTHLGECSWVERLGGLDSALARACTRAHA